MNWYSWLNIMESHTLFMLLDRMSMQAGITKIMNGLKSTSTSKFKPPVFKFSKHECPKVNC